MWRGQVSFGDGWAVYAGEAADQAPHAHAALQIALGGGGSVTIALSGGAAIRGEALVVAPMVRHQLLSADAGIVLVYLDAQIELARAILKEMTPATVGALPAKFGKSFSREIGKLLDQLSKSQAVAPENAKIDGRLSAALEALRVDTSVGSIERAAKVVGVSAPRLRALAQAQMKLPLSQWLLWRKLENASRAIAEGDDLAQAALAGGFADQAHLARTMRRMFGVTPGQAAMPLRKRSVQEGS